MMYILPNVFKILSPQGKAPKNPCFVLFLRILNFLYYCIFKLYLNTNTKLCYKTFKSKIT